MMIIKNYGVLINEKEASCGLIVDPNEYNISFFNDKFLHYEIDVQAACIHVFSDKKKVSFSKIDQQLIYYAYKTETLVIFVGSRKEELNFTNVYEAIIS